MVLFPLRKPARQSRTPGLAGLTLLALWLILGMPALRGLALALTEADARPHLLLGAALLGIALLRVTQNGRTLCQRALAGPRAEPLPLALFGAAAVALSAGRYGSLPPVLLGLPWLAGCYGLFGLYLSGPAFRRGLPLLLVALLLVPFQFHLDAMIGLQVRLLTAYVVKLQLGWLGVAATTVQSILVLDNGVAHVDLPCSGLRSLWSGTLFFLGLSWLRRSRLGLRWLLALAVLLISILYLNQARVLAIVLLTHVAHRSDLADLVHEPLGILFFLLGCAGTSLLLRAEPPSVQTDQRPDSAPPLGSLAAMWLGGGLLLLAVLPATAPSPAPWVAPLVRLPPDWQAAPLAPSNAEADLYARHGGVIYKWRFVVAGPAEQPPIKGSLLISISRSFQAQHPPHVCLATAGLRVTGARRVALRPGQPIAQLAIGNNERSATYWWQSATETTDDAMRRSLAVLPRPGRAVGRSGQPPAWALVSILFDDPVQLAEPAVREPLQQLHDRVAEALQGVP